MPNGGMRICHQPCGSLFLTTLPQTNDQRGENESLLSPGRGQEHWEPLTAKVFHRRGPVAAYLRPAYQPNADRRLYTSAYIFNGPPRWQSPYRIKGEAERRTGKDDLGAGAARTATSGAPVREACKPATVASTRAHYWTLELLFQFSGRSQFLTRAVFSRILTSSLAAT